MQELGIRGEGRGSEDVDLEFRRLRDDFGILVTDQPYEDWDLELRKAHGSADWIQRSRFRFSGNEMFDVDVDLVMRKLWMGYEIQATDQPSKD